MLHEKDLWDVTKQHIFTIHKQLDSATAFGEQHLITRWVYDGIYFYDWSREDT